MLMLPSNYARNIFLRLSIPKSLCAVDFFHQYITLKMYTVVDVIIASQKPALFPSCSQFCECHPHSLGSQTWNSGVFHLSTSLASPQDFPCNLVFYLFFWYVSWLIDSFILQVCETYPIPGTILSSRDSEIRHDSCPQRAHSLGGKIVLPAGGTQCYRHCDTDDAGASCHQGRHRRVLRAAVADPSSTRYTGQEMRRGRDIQAAGAMRAESVVSSGNASRVMWLEHGLWGAEEDLNLGWQDHIELCLPWQGVRPLSWGPWGAFKVNCHQLMLAVREKESSQRASQGLTF